MCCDTGILQGVMGNHNRLIVFKIISIRLKHEKRWPVSHFIVSVNINLSPCNYPVSRYTHDSMKLSALVDIENEKIAGSEVGYEVRQRQYCCQTVVLSISCLIISHCTLITKEQ